ETEAAAEGPRIEVEDPRRPSRSAVGPPELPAGRAVVGAEEDQAAHAGEAQGIGAGGAGVDVEQQRRPAGSAVAQPGLVAVDAVVGLEQEGAAAERQSVVVGGGEGKVERGISGAG